MKKNFNQKQWIKNGDGFAKIHFLRDIHIEEFSIRDSMELGALDYTLCGSKVFCDLSGKIRRRNIFQVCKLSDSVGLTSVDEGNLFGFIEENKIAYEKFEKKCDFPSRFGRVIYINLLANEEKLERLYDDLIQIQKSMSDVFTFRDFTLELESFGYENFLENYRSSDVLSKNLTLAFFNKDYIIRNNLLYLKSDQS